MFLYLCGHDCFTSWMWLSIRYLHASYQQKCMKLALDQCLHVYLRLGFAIFLHTEVLHVHHTQPGCCITHCQMCPDGQHARPFTTLLCQRPSQPLTMYKLYSRTQGLDVLRHLHASVQSEAACVYKLRMATQTECILTYMYVWICIFMSGMVRLEARIPNKNVGESEGGGTSRKPGRR